MKIYVVSYVHDVGTQQCRILFTHLISIIQEGKKAVRINLVTHIVEFIILSSRQC